jgi:hypothetical protein
MTQVKTTGLQAHVAFLNYFFSWFKITYDTKVNSHYITVCHTLIAESGLVVDAHKRTNI